MKIKMLLMLVVGCTSLAVANNLTASDLDYDSIVDVQFVLGTAFLGWTCTNSTAKENNLQPNSKGIYCGKIYGVGYHAQWYLKKGDKIEVHVIGFSYGADTDFIWQLMDIHNAYISLWGIADYPQNSYSDNLLYLGL